MYLTRGTTWTLSHSQDSFSDTSMPPLSTVRAALMMMSLYASAIAAAVFWWVIDVIPRFAYLIAFMIGMCAGT